MQEIFMLVGRIMQTSQFIEWNLALTTRLHLLLNAQRRGSYAEVEQQAKELQEEMQKMTLGEVVEKVRAVRGLNDAELSALKKALYDRNYIAHAYFKDKDFARFSYGELKKEKDYLSATLNAMTRLNDGLCVLIKRQRAVYER